MKLSFRTPSSACPGTPRSLRMVLGSIMSTHLVTVGLDDTLQNVRSLFEGLHIHHLLVIEKGRLVGIVSDRDLLANISPFVGKAMEKPIDAASLKKHVHQIMSRHLITATRETRAEDAARTMLERGISCLPVVDAQGVCVGVITWRDLLRVAYGLPFTKAA